MTETTLASTYDTVVIGGGAAGLNGALVLARSRRSVLVLDDGQPRNAPAEAMHNFLSRDGMNPRELLNFGRAEVYGYGAHICEGTVQSASRVDDGFIVMLKDGRRVRSRRLLVSTGLVDELPDVPGLRERWGRDVIHCPYCHGWEVRDQAVGVLSTGPMSSHQALLFRQLTPDVVFFTHNGPRLTDEQLAQLAARDIRIVSGEVVGLDLTEDHLAAVRLGDGRRVSRTALVIAPRFVARSAVLATLGLRPTTHPTGGEFIATVDPTGRTELPGVWVAGNITDLSAMVISAAAQGAVAAAAINAHLVEEDMRRAVCARRNQCEPGLMNSSQVAGTAVLK